MLIPPALRGGGGGGETFLFFLAGSLPTGCFPRVTS